MIETLAFYKQTSHKLDTRLDKGKQNYIGLVDKNRVG